MLLENLSTPSLVLDHARLQANLARMAAAVQANGVRLRPHMKTAKSIDVARLAAPNQTSLIAVSTLREAEYFFSEGYRDIFYAVGLGPGKVTRASSLLRAGARLLTMVDSISAAQAVRTGAGRENVRFRTVIEIDCGEHRGGLLPTSTDLVPVARALGPHFAGVASHAGQSYDARSADQFAAFAALEIQAVRLASQRLSEAGLSCETVSIGSSPTALARTNLTGVTEMRAGVYMFWDLFQAGIGSCRVEDIALSVLAEVIGRPAGRNEFLIDAGAFALSKDVSTAALPPSLQAGFGRLCDLDGNLLRGLKVARVWQEHGLVVSEQPLPADAFPVGARVRVLPNHACPTASAHDFYHVIDGDRNVVAEWPRIRGW